MPDFIGNALEIDRLVIKRTGWSSLEEMCDCVSHIPCWNIYHEDLAKISDAYDLEMKRRQLPNRALRFSDPDLSFDDQLEFSFLLENVRKKLLEFNQSLESAGAAARVVIPNDFERAVYSPLANFLVHCREFTEGVTDLKQALDVINTHEFLNPEKTPRPSIILNRDKCKIFLSLKPEYWQMFVDGTKTVELRKGDGIKPYSQLIVYSTDPEQKIVGILTVGSVEIAPKLAIWLRAKDKCGVSQQAFFDYYKKQKDATLIHIKSTTMLKRPIEKGELKYYGFRIPMSYRPCDDKDVRLLALIKELSK